MYIHVHIWKSKDNFREHCCPPPRSLTSAVLRAAGLLDVPPVLHRVLGLQVCALCQAVPHGYGD